MPGRLSGHSDADIERSLARYRRLSSTSIAFSAILVVASVYLGFTLNAQFAFGLLGLLPLVSAAYYLSRRRRMLRDLSRIRSEWGRSEVVKERDLSAARSLFDHSHSVDGNDCYVDDQTWNDLNMDQVYAKIDRTLTDPGEVVLYRMLRKPLLQMPQLEERRKVVAFFQNDKEARESVQLGLVRLGHQFVHNDLFNLLWQSEFARSRIKILSSMMALLAVASVVTPVVLLLVSWATQLALQSGYIVLVLMFPVVVFILNLLAHYYIKRRKDIETVSFPYLIRCIKTAKELSSLEHADLSRYTTRLDELFKASRGIVRKARFLFPANQGYGDPATGFLLDYLNIFFLLEIRAFYNTADEMSRHILDLRELYSIVGELDALQSVASYRASLAIYADPEFVEDGTHLELKGGIQPLLDNPVPASISFAKNVTVITGSNMGGKSTFLRNIGNNVLLAQTISTAVASSYRGPFFRVITSISRTDDLIVGKSYYYVEAERILKVIRSLDSGIPTLCLIDELLSGTNSAERLKASEAIIRYLSAQNALAIIATHDVELVHRLSDACDFYHFTDNVDDTGMKFDYLLKPGVATTQNAIALLEFLGYPKEITDRARTQ